MTRKLLLLALALIATPALAQSAVGKAVPEAVALTYVGKTSNNALFLSAIPTGPVKRLTKWNFYKDPQPSSTGPFNTLSVLVEIDCTAGTIQTISGAVLFGELYGADQATKIVQTTSNTQPKATPTPGTVNDAVVKFACAGKIDPNINQRFNTLTEARAYAVVALTS